MSSASSTQRKVPLEVLHLSMPRTGSASMMEAYKILGFSTYHGTDFVDRPDDQVQWEKAVDAKWFGKGRPFERADFDAFLGEFHVLSDLPVIGFSEELLEMYPEAKVVLVDRDLDKWFESYAVSVIPNNYTPIVKILTTILEPYFLRARPATLIVNESHAWFGCHDEASYAASAREKYKSHYAMVRERVPRERLLNYELGSGWGPLCEFLGKKVPNEPFPFKNEREEFRKWMREVQRRKLRDGLWQVVKGVSVVGSGVLAAYVYGYGVRIWG
ncbi:hypothetical protein BU24DRAFT_497956 [Aaosphaeria arxii CBS 175.79]|uniref:P-loop containing nucleoside triphosphate hydrolase protein n=1 Tax=Aaosphaeria arxii CBS 175.79 TaxID=1450172 RepID=A0A6A5X6A6_9PLEO|nr:uncharacterized protein BU24DRAFT_497956 [Aaosphaeria arxii CBS 175.79]KAF2008518.1 hypothetical protein BU24DRAFT_497956 [Aaosphaeria arxii CBS 175.79]